MKLIKKNQRKSSSNIPLSISKVLFLAVSAQVCIPNNPIIGSSDVFAQHKTRQQKVEKNRELRTQIAGEMSNIQEFIKVLSQLQKVIDDMLVSLKVLVDTCEDHASPDKNPAFIPTSAASIATQTAAPVETQVSVQVTPAPVIPTPSASPSPSPTLPPPVLSPSPSPSPNVPAPTPSPSASPAPVVIATQSPAASASNSVSQELNTILQQEGINVADLSTNDPQIQQIINLLASPENITEDVINGIFNVQIRRLRIKADNMNQTYAALRTGRMKLKNRAVNDNLKVILKRSQQIRIPKITLRNLSEALRTARTLIKMRKQLRSTIAKRVNKIVVR
jgi:hypothetical protein